VHVRFGVIRNFLAAIALVVFALPLAAPLTSTATHAQAPVQPVSSINTTTGGACTTVATAINDTCYVSASPALAFNLVGAPHTVTFTCESGVGPSVGNPRAPADADLSGGTANAAAGVVPGCYDVTASVTDETTGAASTFSSARCGYNAATVSSATVNCAAYDSPLCPSGAETTPASVALCDTADPGAPQGSQMAVTLTPGAPHSYLSQFTGYTPLLASCGTVDTLAGGAPQPSNPTGSAVTCDGGTTHACPAGFGYLAPGSSLALGSGFDLTVNMFSPPFELPLPAPDGVCTFTVSAEKKYVELTNLTITSTCTAAPMTLTFSEGLKAYFGTACPVTVTATGVVYVSADDDGVCPGNTTTPAPNVPTVPAGFPPGTKYACSGTTLELVIPITAGTLINPSPIPVSITTTGLVAPYATAPTPTLGTLCFGGSTGTITTTTVGSTFILCPTGPGAGTVQVCYNGPFVDSQIGPICSNTLSFTYTTPANVRVVPYVRWAGEKQVLTKCFGGDGLMSGLPVEFTLGSDSNASAQLIPVSVAGAFFADQSTVWTTTDSDGCASVIVYAADEGVVNVDDSIYSTGGVALINEHAFQIFYLRFESLTLEDPTFTAPSGGPGSFTVAGVTPVGVVGSAPSTPGAVGPSPYSVTICMPDLVRAMVRGYFEFPGNPSGRPAGTITIPGAGSIVGSTPGTGAVTTATLPAGRWVLPDDWPVLATFAGFNATGTPNDFGPGSPSTASPMAWDLNGGNALDQNSADRPITSLAIPTVLQPAGIDPSLGPFFSTDSTGTSYASAGAVPPNLGCDNYGGGLTVGIGPFDITQVCTSTPNLLTPLLLTYTPRGGTILSAGAAGCAGTYCGVFLSDNSTYLPNGTLNEWDAPMPPAQISFGITSGPGFLAPADKRAVYQTANTVTIAGVTYTNVAAYDDPFYGEIIPASPLIPPITNNGGYLWNSFGYPGAAGIAGTGTITGAFVPGEETPTGAVTVADPSAFGCDENGGYTYAASPTAFLPTGGCFIGDATVPPPGGPIDTTVTSNECLALGGHFEQVTPAAGVQPAEGSCEFPQMPPYVAPGTNLTTFGTNCPYQAGGEFLDTNDPSPYGYSDATVELADASGFYVGETVEVYSTTTGNDLATGLTVTAIGAAGAGPNGGTVVSFSTDVPFGTPITNPQVSFCVAPGQGVFIGEDLGFTLTTTASTAPPTVGQTIGFDQTSGVGANTTGTITSVTANADGTYTVFVNGAEALAVALGDCELSRRATLGGSLSFGACEPGVNFLVNGTAATVGDFAHPIQSAADFAGGQGPYLFWNWVPAQGANTNFVPAVHNILAGTASAKTNQTATVYSDNHGEADVALLTGVGAAVYAAGAATALNTTTVTPGLLSQLGFANVAAPGACTASQINAQTGQPNAGVICTNSLGGIEIGCTVVATTGQCSPGTGATLGSTTLQAVADYPYVRGINQPLGGTDSAGSNVITKNFSGAFAKTVTVTPVTTGPSIAGTTTYTVVIHAFDICGNPIVGESVNVFALTTAAGAVVLAPLGVGGTSNGTAAATVVTDSTGTATLTLEVLSNAIAGAGLTIKVVFPAELVERFVVVQSGPTPQQTTTVTYGSGYQTFSAPAPTVVTTAEKIFAYTGAASNPWSDVTNVATSSPGIDSAPPACTGYFAYFAAPTTVTLNLPSSNPASVTCNLIGTWTLLGDPFSVAANLPAGTVAYAWDGTNYTQTTSIAVGKADWVYNPSGATTITLTPAP
jgi:hypothetical protein